MDEALATARRLFSRLAVTRQRPSERLRTPRPLLTSRVASGRGAMEQPNNTDDVARLDLRFWVALLATAGAAGGLGALMMFVLQQVQHLAYGYRSGSFAAAVDRAPTWRPLLALMVGGVVCGPAWYLLRRRTTGNSDVDDSLWTGSGDLAFPRSLGTGVISEIAVGAGASLGREAAPKLLGAASGSVLARWLRLDPGQCRLLVACGAGAGMGAVYNVPLGGALITAELLLGQLSLPVIIPALVCSAAATVVSWVYLPQTLTYVGVPSMAVRPSQLVFALVVGPIVGLASVVFVRLVGWSSHRQLTGRWVLVGPLAALTVLGLLAMPYPLLLGNGKDLIQLAFVGDLRGGLLALLALTLLKPLATVMCLGSGASGGLFTPVMSTGAVLGLLLGRLWLDVWPGPAVASLVIIVAAAMTGAAMQAPLSALVLVLELTGTTQSILIPMIVATALATGVTRRLDGYSIYSARLPGRPPDQEPVDALHS
ncbi:MAG: Chloride channel core [Frankiales bacterium]|nr:Chloride channel core [Frankiales bacterium]